MAQNETPITLVGRMVADPEVRQTPAGASVAGFRVCTQPRIFDKNSGQWGDGDPSFWQCNMWRSKGEAAASQLSKGQLVILTGTVAQRQWQDKDGNNRSTFEVTVHEIGPAVMAPKGGQAGGSYGQPQQSQSFQQQQADPWQSQGSINDPAPF